MSFLEVKHLRKSFPSPEGGESLIVDLEEFSLKPESLYGMKGESGSGKTTFLHLLAGILKPDKGTIILDGQEVSRLNERCSGPPARGIDRLCFSILPPPPRFYLPGERIAGDVFFKTGKKAMGQGIARAGGVDPKDALLSSATFHWSAATGGGRKSVGQPAQTCSCG